MLWTRYRNEEGSQLEPVSARAVGHVPGRRRFILLPGEGVWNHSDPNQLAGSIKYLEQALYHKLHIEKQPIDIFLYSYELPAESFEGRGPHYRMQTNFQGHYGKQITSHVMWPLILEAGETPETMTPALLKERLNEITFVTHSYGSIVAQEAANCLAADLRRMGWEEDVIADTVKQCVSINIASIARTDYPAPNFTQYFFTSMNDMVAVNHIRSEQPQRENYIPLLKQCGYQLIAEVMEAHDHEIPTKQVLAELEEKIEAIRSSHSAPARGMPRPKITPTPSGYSIRAMLPDSVVHWIEHTHEGSEVCRTLDEEEAKRTNTPVVHDFRTYLHSNHHLGDVLLNVINNAADREQMANGHDLLMTTQFTRGLHQDRIRRHDAAVSLRGIGKMAL